MKDESSSSTALIGNVVCDIVASDLSGAYAARVPGRAVAGNDLYLFFRIYYRHTPAI